MFCSAGILRRIVRPLHTEELSVWIRSLIPVPRTPAFYKSSLIASGIAVIIFLGFSGGRIPILGEAIGYIKAYIDPKHLLTNSSPPHLTWLFQVSIEPKKSTKGKRRARRGPRLTPSKKLPWNQNFRWLSGWAQIRNIGSISP